MMTTLRHMAITAFAAAVATAFLGWWAVPVVGLGWALQPAARHAVLESSVGALLGWSVLLGLTATRGDVGRVAERVGGALELPAAGFIAVTLLFPALLAGAAAALGREVLKASGRVRSSPTAPAIALMPLLLISVPQPLEGQASLDSVIRAEVERYVAAVNGGDARAVADLYARTAGATSAGDGAVTRGWTGIRALLGDFQAALGQVTMTADSIAVAPVGDRGAVAVFLYTWVARRGAETRQMRGAMTLVYERTPQGWRVVHDHTSTRAAGRQGVEQLGEESPPVALSRPLRETAACTVERIVDGDTLECRGGPRVRLIGIDTPELSQQPFGWQARDVLEALVPAGTAVLLERDVELTDQYGRRLAYVWRDGVFVNWQMLRGGWAMLLTVPPNVQYVEQFEQAQRRARASRSGLWGTNGFECPPAERRRGRCD